jgi:hypothetical protein
MSIVRKRESHGLAILQSLGEAYKSDLMYVSVGDHIMLDEVSGPL